MEAVDSSGKVQAETRRKILAVDDEIAILDVYYLFLQHHGYDVTVAANAQQCMESLMHFRPDIILLDVNMPGIDGLMLLEMIRATDKGRDVPIMMISAKNDERTIKDAARLGCDSFVIKPFKMQDIARRIALELITVDARFVYDCLKSVRFQKNMLMRESGLGKYDSEQWDGYGFTQDGFQFCLLAPRGVRLQAVARFDERKLRDKVKILCKHKTRWRLVWPRS